MGSKCHHNILTREKQKEIGGGNITTEAEVGVTQSQVKELLTAARSWKRMEGRCLLTLSYKNSSLYTHARTHTYTHHPIPITPARFTVFHSIHHSLTCDILMSSFMYYLSPTPSRKLCKGRHFVLLTDVSLKPGKVPGSK